MGGQVTNALGIGLGVVNDLMALRNGNLGAAAAARAMALNDPRVRAGLVDSPFLAGTLGVRGGQQSLVVPPTYATPGPEGNMVGVPTQTAPAQTFQQWTPRLAPMDLESQVAQTNFQGLQQLGQQNPALRAVIGGYGTPEQFGQVIQQSPQNVISNLTARSGQMGMFQRPMEYMPWALRARVIQETGQDPGAVTTYEGPSPLATVSSPTTPSSPAALAGTPVMPNPGRGPANLTVPPEMTAAAGGGVPGGLRPLTQPTPPPASTLPPGFIPLEELDAFEAGSPTVGYPPALGGQTPPTQPAAPLTPDQVFGAPPAPTPPREVTSVTKPKGLVGSETTKQLAPPNVQADRQKLLDAARAKGVPSETVNEIQASLLASDAFTTLLNKFAPMDPYTGKRDYSVLAQHIGKYHAMGEDLKNSIPFAGYLPIEGLNPNPEYQELKNLLGAVGINIVTFAGKQIPAEEMKLFAPLFRGELNMSAPEFFARFKQLGKTIARVSQTTAQAFDTRLNPELRQELESVGAQDYAGWQ